VAIVNSPFGKALTAIAGPERADFIGIPDDRYGSMPSSWWRLLGHGRALIMVNDRSVYPDLAHWTQSTQVLLMSCWARLHFFGPIVGALLLRTLDATSPQN